MLQLTGVVDERMMRAQYLDRMDIERERGITIKAQNVRLPWRGRTRSRARAAPDRHPGPRRLHLRGLAARWRRARARSCWSTRRRASRRRRWPTSTWRWRRTSRSSRCSTRSTCPPPTRTATPPRSRTSSAATPTRCCGSARRPAQGVREVLDEVVRQVPAPVGDADAPARAMIFDSVYDTYRGVITYIRVVDGADHPARADQDDVHGRHPRAARGRHRLAGAEACRSAWASARSATSSPA